MARGVGAIAESTADPVPLNGIAFQDIGTEVGIGEDHPSDPHKIGPAVFDGIFCGMGEEVLQAGVSGSDCQNIRTKLFQAFYSEDMASHVIQWGFGHFVAVRHRIIGGSLHVDIIIRASDGGADQFHAVIVLHHFDQLHCFRQIRIHIHAITGTAERVGIIAIPFHGDAYAVAAFDERFDIEQADAGGKFQSRHIFPDPVSDLPVETGPVFKGSAVTKEGLDTATVDGITYYIKGDTAPKCYEGIISKTSLN